MKLLVAVVVACASLAVVASAPDCTKPAAALAKGFGKLTSAQLDTLAAPSCTDALEKVVRAYAKSRGDALKVPLPSKECAAVAGTLLTTAAGVEGSPACANALAGAVRARAAKRLEAQCAAATAAVRSAVGKLSGAQAEAFVNDDCHKAALRTVEIYSANGPAAAAKSVKSPSKACDAVLAAVRAAIAKLPATQRVAFATPVCAASMSRVLNTQAAATAKRAGKTAKFATDAFASSSSACATLGCTAVSSANAVATSNGFNGNANPSNWGANNWGANNWNAGGFDVAAANVQTPSSVWGSSWAQPTTVRYASNNGASVTTVNGGAAGLTWDPVANSNGVVATTVSSGLGTSGAVNPSALPFVPAGTACLGWTNLSGCPNVSGRSTSAASSSGNGRASSAAVTTSGWNLLGARLV